MPHIPGHDPGGGSSTARLLKKFGMIQLCSEDGTKHPYFIPSIYNLGPIQKPRKESPNVAFLVGISRMKDKYFAVAYDILDFQVHKKSEDDWLKLNPSTLKLTGPSGALPTSMKPIEQYIPSDIRGIIRKLKAGSSLPKSNAAQSANQASLTIWGQEADYLDSPSAEIIYQGDVGKSADEITEWLIKKSNAGEIPTIVNMNTIVKMKIVKQLVN